MTEGGIQFNSSEQTSKHINKGNKKKVVSVRVVNGILIYLEARENVFRGYIRMIFMINDSIMYRFCSFSQNFMSPYQNSGYKRQPT